MKRFVETLLFGFLNSEPSTNSTTLLPLKRQLGESVNNEQNQYKINWIKRRWLIILDLHSVDFVIYIQVVFKII